MFPSPIDKYSSLISDFLACKIGVDPFEERYLALFKAERQPMSERDFLILDELFADVDAYCGDPDLRTADDLNETQLREKCKLALDRLASTALK